MLILVIYFKKFDSDCQSHSDDSIYLKGLSVLKTSLFLFISRSFLIRTISIQYIVSLLPTYKHIYITLFVAHMHIHIYIAFSDLSLAAFVFTRYFTHFKYALQSVGSRFGYCLLLLFEFLNLYVCSV